MGNGVLLLGGLAALWFLSKANTGKNLQFLPLGANWDGGALHISIGVQNPTDGGLLLSSMAAQVQVNGITAGNVSTFTPTTILPNAQTPVTLTFVPNILGAVSALFNQISNGGGVAIRVIGSANVNSINLPIVLTFQAIKA